MASAALQRTSRSADRYKQLCKPSEYLRELSLAYTPLLESASRAAASSSSVLRSISRKRAKQPAKHHSECYKELRELHDSREGNMPKRASFDVVRGLI
jgi:hypothetical protein